MKRFHVLIVGGLLLASTACGRDDDGDAGDSGDAGDAGDSEPAGASQPAAPEGDVEGSINVWAMGTEGEMLGVLAEDFMAEYPEVSVDVTPVPWEAAHDRIVNAIAAGEVPDASMIGTTWMGEFASLGGLDQTPDRIDSSQYFEGAWETTVVDGVSYAVPWYVETRLVYYRTDLAEAGGFTDEPADWEGLKELAEAQVEGGADIGISLQPGGTGAWQTFMPFFWQAGGVILDESGSFGLDSEACVEALTYYDSFSESGLAPSAASDVPVEGQFANGEVGAFISGPWMIGVLGEAGADPATWTVAPQPTEEAGTSFVGGSNFAVMDQSDNKPAAWAFVEYLMRPEVQVKWYQEASSLPSVMSAWDDETLAGDDLLAAFGEQLEEAEAPPSIATWEQIAAEIDGQIEQVVQGDATPEDACAAMQREAESIGTGL